MKKYFALLLLACMVAVTASAQLARTLSGIVTDSLLKSPLAHAAVRVKGSNVSTITGKKGQFSLKVARCGGTGGQCRWLSFRGDSRSCRAKHDKSIINEVAGP